MIEIREITAEQWREWRSLRLQALADEPAAFGSRLADWQDAAEWRWRARLSGGTYDVVAALDGESVGMASGMPDGAGPAELISLWVAPPARGQGVADVLVQRIARWAAPRAGELTLRVLASNARAIAFYRRCGFVDRGVVDGVPGPVERRMTLVLNSPQSP